VKKAVCSIVLLAVLACEYVCMDAVAGTALPPDVAAFVERRDLCDHFRGEDPYDEERAAFLKENIERYCTGTDAELARLKDKYSGDKAVMDILNGYEDDIEPDADSGEK